MASEAYIGARTWIALRTVIVIPSRYYTKTQWAFNRIDGVALMRSSQIYQAGRSVSRSDAITKIELRVYFACQNVMPERIVFARVRNASFHLFIISRTSQDTRFSALFPQPCNLQLSICKHLGFYSQSKLIVQKWN